MIIDGRSIAKDILTSVAADVLSLDARPRLVAFAGDASAATESYLKIKKSQAEKANVDMDIIPLDGFPKSMEGYDAVIVQLPLPGDLDTNAVLNAIPVSLDADVLSQNARELFERGEAGALLPPVVDAIREVLLRSEVSIAGKRAVVLGQGWLVGAPAATWLQQQGADVTVLTSETTDEECIAALRAARIIISGVGKPGIIKPEHLSEGVVLIDAGTSESGGAIVGDADPACAAVASVFTPVPGGMGPIAVACLFRNVAKLAIARNSGESL